MTGSPDRETSGPGRPAVEPVKLARRIGLRLVTLCGLGTIIGALLCFLLLGFQVRELIF